MSEIRYKTEMRWKDGTQVKYEVKEWYNTRNNEMIKQELTISDRHYYSYLELKERYAQGLISDDMLNVILDGDNLRRFCKNGDFVREVMDSSVMDARIAKTIEYEKKWEVSMMLRRKNPTAWGNALGEIVGDIFKEL